MAHERKVLVIGSGGREHALALRLLESDSVGEVVVCPGNPGTEKVPEEQRRQGKRMCNLPGDPMAEAVPLIEREDIALAVIGPEAPLCAGLSDQLTARGVPTFGPSKQAARLEGSKAFMKQFAVRHGIRTARHRVVRSAAELDAALGSFSHVPVVKADGLCAGKGVVLADDFEGARGACLRMLSGESFGPAGKTVVLEEKLTGFETSVHALCDGKRSLLLPAAQDHKRLGAGDTGPNTGGMGTFAPTPRVGAPLLKRIETEIVERAVAGMQAEGHPFLGALFAGVMVSDAGEPILLEFNVRFGDPETQVLMGLMAGDLAGLMHATALGGLPPEPIAIRPEHSVCVVLAAHGYPDAPRNGDAISGLDAAELVDGVQVYHAGTRWHHGQLVTAGGRVLGVTARAPTLALARERAYMACDLIQFEGKQWRHDIGSSVGP